MEKFYSSGDFVCRDTLTWTAAAGTLTLEGEIACKGNIVIAVWKVLDVLDSSDDPEVQTVRYAYNAFVRDCDNIVRHDNVHAHPGHPDQHHRHDFNWRTGAENRGSPRWCGAANWPSLSDFIQVVADWYWAHREELPAPDAVPTLGLR
jgi:hypothetical protein